MKILSIDKNKCVKCKECIKECPERLFYVYIEKDRKPEIHFDDPYGDCRQCGHCIAVCPVSAIKFKAAEKPQVFNGIENPSTLISYDTLLKFLKARRAVRQFKSKSIPKVKIDLVLEAMRYAPTALNSQRLSYVVITDKVKIESIVSESMNMLKIAVTVLKFKRLLRFFSYFSNSIKRLFIDFSEASAKQWLIEYESTGKDNVFYFAPCIIVVYSPSYGYPGNETGIALTHGMLAAQSLGLGTCWIGWAQGVLSRSRRLRASIGVPAGQKVWGVMALSYPDVKYYRIPMRKHVSLKRLS